MAIVERQFEDESTWLNEDRYSTAKQAIYNLGPEQLKSFLVCLFSGQEDDSLFENRDPWRIVYQTEYHWPAEVFVSGQLPQRLYDQYHSLLKKGDDDAAKEVAVKSEQYGMNLNMALIAILRECLEVDKPTPDQVEFYLKTVICASKVGRRSYSSFRQPTAKGANRARRGTLVY